MEFADNRIGGSNPFFCCTRPPYYWDVVGAHLVFGLVTGIPLLLSHWVPRTLLPLKACAFLHLTGYPGPFCGFTRSFWAMAQGDWIFAMHNSPLACVLYLVAALVFAWNAAGLLLGVKIACGRFLKLSPGQTRWAGFFIIVMLFLNWGYRLSLGLR
jgi:hypothetical protein